MYIISHFLNEEFLLPYWLKHHVPMFDHGIMIDYGSTDKSVDIIRDLAPNWEVRKTSVEKFVEPFIGDEIQSIEQSLPADAWKIVLNTTEFLFCADLREFIKRFEKEFPGFPGFRTNGVLMIDSVEEQFKLLTDESLLFQRCFGLVERKGQRNPIYAKHGGFSPMRCRFMHKLIMGYYTNGRHGTVVQMALRDIDRKYGLDDDSWWGDIPKKWAEGWEGIDPEMNVPKPVPEWVKDSWCGIHPEIFTCWFGRFSPFESIKKRVAGLDYRVPRKSFVNGKTPNSPDDTTLLERELDIVRPKSKYLLDLPAYGEYYQKLYSV